MMSLAVPATRPTSSSISACGTLYFFSARQVPGRGVELVLGNSHALVGVLHVAARVLQRAAGDRADELDHELLDAFDPLLA